MAPLAQRPLRHLSRHCSSVGRTAKAAKRPKMQRRMSAPAALQSRTTLVVPKRAVQLHKLQHMPAPRDYLRHVPRIVRAELLHLFLLAFAHSGASLTELELLAQHGALAFRVRAAHARHFGVLRLTIGSDHQRVAPALLRRTLPHALPEVRRLYTAVVDERVRVHEARARLAHLCAKPAARRSGVQVALGAVLAAVVSAVVCGGGVVDVVAAVVGAVLLGCVQLVLLQADAVVAEFLQTCASIYLAFLAHDPHTSPAITSILPGYLYLCCTVKHNPKYTRMELFVALCASMYAAALAHGLPLCCDVFLVSQLVGLVVLFHGAAEKLLSRAPAKLAL
ncbi:hypothetical protein PsYK624_036450 [Phanerochaete sordida]|uniref:Threonine/serine exporter-like N-terminal domain-containing protein n=1 Tax=Phanerochaete sordida TaxID=48140 RepID=A0A9P3G209_9APHY|nr:hypothetical protein PsYK624_036450 [Phanerochaete sordida]